MPISAQQWRLAVGRANASRSLRPHVTSQPKMKLTSLDIILFILTALLGAIMLYREGGRGTGERKCVSRGSGGGGTVGELVPSLLTAPCRKELLMLAGDVETNPGPFTCYDSQLRRSDLELVVEELRGVEEKWRVIGRELGVRVDYIMHPDPTDCMREVVWGWLQMVYIVSQSWKDIIVALRKANEHQLADNLKAKYIPDLLEESDLDLLTQELKPVQHKWESIGRELHPFYFDAYLIRYQYHDDGDRLRAILKQQLQLPYTTTTWRNIVDALRSPDVGESQLADQLEAKYCPNVLRMSDLDLLVQELSIVQKKWKRFGKGLGVQTSLLDRIRTNYSDLGDRMREVLSERIQRQYTNWRGIIAVLKSSHIGEPKLAAKLEAKYCPTAQKILEEALEKGYVDSHIWKVLVTGAAGSGKTTLKHRLFREEPPSVRCSTALAEAAIRAISREIVGTDQTGWFRVSYEELMEMLGGALKAGVPMEQSRVLSAEEPKVAFHKKPGKLSWLLFWKEKQSRRSNKQLERAGKQSDKQLQRAHSTIERSQLPLETSMASSQASQTSISTQDPSSKQELLKLVDKLQGSKRFLELHWIHFIDSGGQPQFHEVLPAFIRNTTATIFVMRLSERLDEHPMVEYFDVSGQRCGKHYCHALSNDQILQCCVRTIMSRPSTKEGKHSKTLVVGTHEDIENLCSETRSEKNRKLLDMLKLSLQDQLVYYRLDSEVIFPINAKNPSEQDHQVCAMIRKQIEDEECAPPPYKIPIGWFLLEQDIINTAKGGVISKSECLGIAAVLNINADALTAALEYFDELNIFLYYPAFLPEVVFCNPQILLDKVTELVHFSYSLHSDNPPTALEGKWLQFRDKGIVTLEMFNDKRFSAHYIPDLFTPANLITLFEHLLIIASISSTEYFMPSLLQMITSEQVAKELSTTSSSVAPLLVHFPAGCAQNGIFCALVVYLLSECHWEFAKGNLECVSRSCVCFKVPNTPVSIALVDSFSFFKVSVEAPQPMYPKICPKIQEAIFSGVEAAARALKYNNSKPKPAFLCGKCSSESPPHAATPATDGCYLVCTKSESYEPLTERHTEWFDMKQPATHFTEGAGIPAVQATMISPTIETMLQSKQVSHHQHQHLQATARQPHAPSPESSYYLPSQQHTKPWIHTHDTGAPLFDSRSLQKQEVEPQVIPSGHEVIGCQSEQHQCNSPQQQHPPSQRDQIDRPTLIACIRFRGRERRINIPQEIGVNYQDFGLFLLEDENRQRVKAIAHSYQNKAEEINKEILEQWITGRGKHPVTWKTLTEVLRDIELTTLAEEIELAIQH